MDSPAGPSRHCWNAPNNARRDPVTHTKITDPFLISAYSVRHTATHVKEKSSFSSWLHSRMKTEHPAGLTSASSCLGKGMLVFQLKTHELVLNCWSSLCFTLSWWYDTDNHKPAFSLICHLFGLEYYLSTYFSPKWQGSFWAAAGTCHPFLRGGGLTAPLLSPEGSPLHSLLTQCSWAPLQAAISHCSSCFNLSQVALGQILLQPHRNAVSDRWLFSNCFLLLLLNLLTQQDTFGWDFDTLFFSLLTVVLQMSFFLPVSPPADHTEVGVASDTRAVAARLVWVYQGLGKAQ